MTREKNNSVKLFLILTAVLCPCLDHRLQAQPLPEGEQWGPPPEAEETAGASVEKEKEPFKIPVRRIENLDRFRFNISGGASWLAMNQVNGQIKSSENYLKTYLGLTPTSTTLGLAPQFNADLSILLEHMMIGTSLNYIAGSATQGASQGIASWNANWDVKTIEIIPYVGTWLIAPGHRVMFFGKTGAGFGYATAQETVTVSSGGIQQSQDELTVSSGNRGYWAFLLQGDMEMILSGQSTLTASAGYRFANAGVLYGTSAHSQLAETAFKTDNGSDMQFDFSGPFILLGLALRL